MELNEGVGLAEGTYAYDSSGNIWGHEVEGCKHGVNDRPYINKEPFEDGHVVGCGMDLKKREIFYTLNGGETEEKG
uniref:SPRY domain-containing protein n=1 Tax=Globodera rostochiensis TaxID=31243 RepID=A0A914HK77_GLORO